MNRCGSIDNSLFSLESFAICQSVNLIGGIGRKLTSGRLLRTYPATGLRRE
jgi:hypothetical protein